jgi:hypothetical protein
LQVPSLTDGWHELRDKYISEKDNFKALVLEKHAVKQAEHDAWLAEVAKACRAQDGTANERILAFEKLRKRAVRRVHDDGERPADALPAVRVRRSYPLSVLSLLCQWRQWCAW